MIGRQLCSRLSLAFGIKSGRCNLHAVRAKLIFPSASRGRSIAVEKFAMAGIGCTLPVSGDICFHDFLPIMAQKIGQEDFLKELCNGFRMLADPRTNTITIQSLKKNARRLGLEGMTDQEFREMIAQGDLDADGVLSEREFCALMIRSSPALLAQAETWLLDALDEELLVCMEDSEDDN